jgi:hypothetical protein
MLDYPSCVSLANRSAFDHMIYPTFVGRTGSAELEKKPRDSRTSAGVQFRCLSHDSSRSAPKAACTLSTSLNCALTGESGEK